MWGGRPPAFEVVFCGPMASLTMIRGDCKSDPARTAGTSRSPFDSPRCHSEFAQGRFSTALASLRSGRDNNIVIIRMSNIRADVYRWREVTRRGGRAATGVDVSSAGES